MGEVPVGWRLATIDDVKYDISTLKGQFRAGMEW